jgi:hypothetical protein
MEKSSPRHAIVPAIIRRLFEALDHRVFRDDEIRQAARGLRVARPRRFVRQYRDPRWDRVSVCEACAGNGNVSARTCPECAGNGRIIAGPAENVGVS